MTVARVVGIFLLAMALILGIPLATTNFPCWEWIVGLFALVAIGLLFLATDQ